MAFKDLIKNQPTQCTTAEQSKVAAALARAWAEGRQTAEIGAPALDALEAKASFYKFISSLPNFIANHYSSKLEYVERKRGEVAAVRFVNKLMGGEFQRRISLVMKRYSNLPTYKRIQDLERLHMLENEEADADGEKVVVPATERKQLALVAKPQPRREKLLCELELEEVQEMAFQISKVTNQILANDHGKAESMDEYNVLIKDSFNKLNSLCFRFGVASPIKKKEPTTRDYETGVLKLVCEKWWFSRLKKHARVMREHLAIAAGLVSSRANSYVSYSCLKDYQAQQKKNFEVLNQMELFDVDTHETMPLLDMVLKSVGNPAIRRMELMVRTRGCEDIANELGLHGLFVTMTTPSRFHNVYKKTGAFVPQWDGSSPRDAQAYLNQVWARIRAKLHRKEIGIFGVRVAEPHHDGTPHWHMLVWCKSEDVAVVKEIFEGYATAVDRDELGDDITPRIDLKDIDPDKGSATGYIAKYISKNIDGYAMDGELSDETSKPVSESAKAVTAWKNQWAIRQFQFIGGAPVSTYRELRKLANLNRNAFREYLAMQERAQLIEMIQTSIDENFVGAPLPLHKMKTVEIIERMITVYTPSQQNNESINGVMISADDGNWGEYVRQQGGVFVKRDELVIRNHYKVTEMGTVYGEDSSKLQGVLVVENQDVITTRTRTFEIRKKKTEELKDEVNAALALDALALKKGGTAAPWSSVNNCTVPFEGESRGGLSEKLAKHGIDIDDHAGRAFVNGATLNQGGVRVKIRDGYVDENGNQRPPQLVEVTQHPKHESGALSFMGSLSDFVNMMQPDGEDSALEEIPQRDVDEGYVQPDLHHWFEFEMI